jgi:hypothetical protein
MIPREFPPIVAEMRAKVGELARSDQHTDIPTSLGSASSNIILLLPSSPQRDQPVFKSFLGTSERLPAG